MKHKNAPRRYTPIGYESGYIVAMVSDDGNFVLTEWHNVKVQDKAHFINDLRPMNFAAFKQLTGVDLSPVPWKRERAGHAERESA